MSFLVPDMTCLKCGTENDFYVVMTITIHRTDGQVTITKSDIEGAETATCACCGEVSSVDTFSMYHAKLQNSSRLSKKKRKQ